MARDDEDLYRLVVDHSPQGVVVVAFDPMRLHFANPAMVGLVGHSIPELLAMTPRQVVRLVHRGDRKRLSDVLERLAAGETDAVREDCRLVRRDRSSVWVQSSATRVELEGKPAVLLAFADDTDRRGVLDALRRSQAKLLQAQYIARIGDFSWDIASGSVSWSDGMYRLLQYDPTEEIDLARVNAEIHHSDDLERVTAWLNAGIASGERFLPPNEYRLVCRDGSVIHVQTKGTFDVENGKAVRLFGTVQDITARKRADDALRESERRLVAAQRLANLGDWWWNVSTGEVEWSDQVYEIFGLSRDRFRPHIDSILALSPWPEDHQRDQELIQRAIESRVPGSYEQRFLRPDGSTGYYASTFLGVYDDHGALAAIRGTIQDITERKRAEQEKDRLLQQLHHAQKMESIGRLAGGVAHDFNNILCAISGQTELALDDANIGDDARSLMRGVLEAAGRASRLTRQLLAFSRKQVVEAQIVDLSELIQRLEPMLRRLIGEDIVLRTVPQSELGRVKVDPGLVEQIVLNLAVNARDAMPSGGELVIETCDADLDASYCEDHATTVSGSYVMLAVSDTGVGIPPEVQDKVFEPFFTTKEEGTGLGLATVFAIVERSDGRIELYSEQGRGTTFKVYFPLISAPKENSERSEVRPVSDGNETILVVEDEEMVRSLAVRLLRSRGYEVLTVDSAPEALVVSAQYEGHIDLLLTDVVMPGMDGRELATILSRERPQMRVLFTSGYTKNVIAQHGVLDDGLNFLSKPYSRDSLVAKVRGVLDAPT